MASSTDNTIEENSREALWACFADLTLDSTLEDLRNVAEKVNQWGHDTGGRMEFKVEADEDLTLPATNYTIYWSNSADAFEAIRPVRGDDVSHYLAKTLKVGREFHIVMPVGTVEWKHKPAPQPEGVWQMWSFKLVYCINKNQFWAVAPQAGAVLYAHGHGLEDPEGLPDELEEYDGFPDTILGAAVVVLHGVPIAEVVQLEAVATDVPDTFGVHHFEGRLLAENEYGDVFDVGKRENGSYKKVGYFGTVDGVNRVVTEE